MSVASQFERQMLDLINQERTSRGLDPLTLELRLNDASEDHSVWMDDTLNFSHTGVGGSSPGDRMRDAGFEFTGSWTWGENIAYQSERGAPGISDDVVNLHQSLMNSPGHRANILNPDFELIGIGIEEGDNRGFDAVYVTQNFARTSANVQLDDPSTPTPRPQPPVDDRLTGSNGNDSLVGTGGDDDLRGLSGSDTMSGRAGDDLMFGGNGNDRASGHGGDDRMWGGAGNDRMAGGQGDDSLKGEGGDDRLNGGRGNDRLDGGAGNDRLTGKSGADTFVFSTGRDIVTDFNPNAAGERINLRDVDSITGFNDLMNGGHARQIGDNVEIRDFGGNTLVLADVDLDALQQNDFLF